MWLAFVFIVCYLAEPRRVYGVFIVPEPQITNLTLWAELHVNQNCDDDCHSGFNNDSCTLSGVCYLKDICNGRQGFPPVEHPLSDWSPHVNSAGCNVTTEQPHKQPYIFLTDMNVRTLLVNGSAVGAPTPCYSHRNGSADQTFTLVFWLMADCSNW